MLLNFLGDLYLGSAAEGIIYGVLALGVLITFRILDFPDLTVDGSYPMGAAIFAICTVKGVAYPLTLLLVLMGGWLAGTVTALIHNQLKVPGLLSGILTMVMLYPINLRILGRPNYNLGPLELPLEKFRALFAAEGSAAQQHLTILYFFLGLLLVKLLLDLYFHTEQGLALGALGSNEQMITSQGVDPRLLKWLGISLSNALVALAGAMFAQYQGFADVNSGSGTVVMGLAIVMIGEFFVRSSRIGWITLGVVLGALVYKAITYTGMALLFRASSGGWFQVYSSDLRLITGLLTILVIWLSRRRQRGLFFWRKP